MEVKPGYKQTEVGVIPEEWNVEVVGDAFEIRNQLRLPISKTGRERMSGPYPYYGPTSVQGWINEYRVEGEHALIGEDGDHFLKWRDQAMTLLVTGKFNVNNHAHIVRGTKNLTAWFYWFFANRDISSYLTRQGAGRYKLTKATLLTLPCALPEPPEQRAIATALSDVDGLLGGLDRLIAKKRDLKQAAMQQLLTAQTRLPGFHGEWEVKRVLDLGDVVTGGTPLTDVAVFWGEGYPWITPTDISSHRDMFSSERTLTQKGLNAVRALPANTVPVTCIASIGKNAILKTAGACNQQINAVIPNRDSSAEFLYYVFEASKQFLLANAGTTATSIISKAAFAQLAFTVPRLPEQTPIAEVLTDMDAELVALEQRREKTRALKQAIMQELLTGRTRLVARGGARHTEVKP